MLKTVIDEASERHDEFKAELIKIRNEHESKINELEPENETWNDMGVIDGGVLHGK